jgi:hypothetical protein
MPSWPAPAGHRGAGASRGPRRDPSRRGCACGSSGGRRGGPASESGSYVKPDGQGRHQASSPRHVVVPRPGHEKQRVRLARAAHERSPARVCVCALMHGPVGRRETRAAPDDATVDAGIQPVRRRLGVPADGGRIRGDLPRGPHRPPVQPLPEMLGQRGKRLDGGRRERVREDAGEDGRYRHLLQQCAQRLRGEREPGSGQSPPHVHPRDDALLEPRAFRAAGVRGRQERALGRMRHRCPGAQGLLQPELGCVQDVVRDHVGVPQAPARSEVPGEDSLLPGARLDRPPALEPRFGNCRGRR